MTEVKGSVDETEDFEIRLLRQSIIEQIGCIPTSSKAEIRFFRGTNIEEAMNAIKRGYLIDDKFGFGGNAVVVSSDPDKAMNEIIHTHRDAPVVIIFNIPNFRKLIVSLQENEVLPRDFRIEMLFSAMYRQDENSVLPASSGSVSGSSSIIEPRFIEGYFDKDERVWHPNPEYWLNKLKQECEQEKISQTECEIRRKKVFGEIAHDAARQIFARVSDCNEEKSRLERAYSDLLSVTSSTHDDTPPLTQ